MVDVTKQVGDHCSIRSIPAMLAHKLGGGEMTSDDISFLIDGITSNKMEDSQLGTLLAAVFMKGMSDSETASLTKCMRDSGNVFEWPADWKVVDKHSTGGVGDKVSLILTPALASLALKVPMISGRGLGHTGGTLDKLESIPGYRVSFDGEDIYDALKTVGCCIVGQTKSLVPADKRMYSIRDITATVASTPLIVSSIISKKACENLQALVLDVKYGAGSLFKFQNEAESLANALVYAGNSLGIHTTALVTNMAVPLGKTIGNALEVAESVQCLLGNGPPDLEKLVVELGGELVNSSGLADTVDEGTEMIRKTLHDGRAIRKFSEMLSFQGVSDDAVNDICAGHSNSKFLPRAKCITKLFAEQTGTIVGMNAFAIAQVCLHLGAGRVKASDEINHAVGMVLIKVVGENIEAEEPWAEIHHDGNLEEHLLLQAQRAISITKDNYDATKHILIANRIR